MTTLYIAEKYGVAKVIASVLSGSTSGGAGQGWFEKQDGTRITWSVGHILELYMPEDYDPRFQKWRVDDYPVFPQQWKLKPIEKTVPQFRVIAQLLKTATTVVHAGDPDREGQLLIDEILAYCNYKGRVRRILPNDTEPSAIADALRHETDNAAKRGLYNAGLARQRADWLVGINGTRVATQGLGDGRLISIGRVQTIVVWLVVKRDELIEQFASKPFYELEIDFKTAAGDLVTLLYAPAEDDRIWDEQVMREIAGAVTAAKTAKAQVSVAKKTERAPLPYTLREFQQHASRLFKWPASKSLQQLSATYLAGFTTYPRTDIPYLRTEQADIVPEILAALRSFPRLEAALATFSSLPSTPVVTRRLFDSTKVKEHHGIIPSKLSFRNPDGDRKGEQAATYELVAKRYLMALMPNRTFEETSISASIAGVVATTRAEVTTEQGWRALDPKPDGKTLPKIQDGENLSVAAVRLVPKKTSPPKPYTDDTLLGDMANIAKYVANPDLKARLKKGVGTPATQAETIDTIIRREYVYRERGTVRSTGLGRSMIAAVPAALIDPGITALWEEALDHLENGLVTLEAFTQKIEAFTTRIVAEMKERSLATKISGAGAPAAEASKKMKTPRKKRPLSNLRPGAKQ